MSIKSFFLIPMILFSTATFSFATEMSLGVYIWSTDLEMSGISEIDKFIETKKIKRIELSYKPFAESEKVRAWMKKLKAQGKAVDLVLSEPLYIFPDKWHEVKNRLIDIYKSGYDVHFDVEPHILPDFKENSDEYLELFIGLLRKAHSLGKRFGKKTSVAISVSHYKRVMDDIFENSDLVVFMSYGFKSVRRVEHIVSSYDKNRVAVALRAKDFSSEKELLEYIKDVAERTDVKIFIVHNLRQWKTLNRK